MATELKVFVLVQVTVNAPFVRASLIQITHTGTSTRGAPDLDPDPAGYPVFFQDPVGSGSGQILKYRIRQNPDPAGSKQSGSGQPDSLPCTTW